MAAGPVHEFSLLRPSLTELYRHVVTTDTTATDRETVSA